MSGTVGDCKRLIRVTAGNLRNNSISIAGHYDFFPPDCIGPPKKSRTGKTRPIEIVLDGLNKTVETDIGTDAKTGKPRRILRGRWWAREFFQHHRIQSDDVLYLEKIATRQYRLSQKSKRCRATKAAIPLFDKALSSQKLGRNPPITFVDLFAGIGGMRLGFEGAGARCVFSCEWDKHAQKTYEANFGEKPAGDIRQLDPESIPDHDVLVAGFPCQPFSIAGVSKKNALGQAHGFRCNTQGTLFFDLARIIEAKQPQAFLLENVKNLQRHDQGRTFSTIMRVLEQELGYDVTYRVLDAKIVVPQHRERIFIVGFRSPRLFELPDKASFLKYRVASTLGDILERNVLQQYTLTDHLWNYLQNYAEKHRRAGNGFGFGLVGKSDTTRTLSARYYKDGSEILVRQVGRNPRRLTPRECARLMGFPDSFRIPVSDTQAYRQFGNSVAVPLIHAIAERIIKATASKRNATRNGQQFRLRFASCQ